MNKNPHQPMSIVELMQWTGQSQGWVEANLRLGELRSLVHRGRCPECLTEPAPADDAQGLCEDCRRKKGMNYRGSCINCVDPVGRAAAAQKIDPLLVWQGIASGIVRVDLQYEYCDACGEPRDRPGICDDCADWMAESSMAGDLYEVAVEEFGELPGLILACDHVVDDLPLSSIEDQLEELRRRVQ